jgi:uncharacterized protein (DUF3820 family)
MTPTACMEGLDPEVLVKVVSQLMSFGRLKGRHLAHDVV